MGNVIGNHWEHGGNITIVGKKISNHPLQNPVPFKKKKTGQPLAC
jgi:hypothetical protein